MRSVSSKPAHKKTTIPEVLAALLPSLFLILAVLLAYVNVYHNPPVLDDKNIIMHNAELQSFSGMLKGGAGMTGFYRPLQMGLYFCIYQLFGASLPAFHALNVILHAANAMLVFWLGRRLGFKTAAAFLAALLWAVHPINTSAVDMMSATAAPLACFFMLAGMLALLPDFSARKLCYAVLLFICALASKQSAVVFPALVTACLFLVSKERLRLATYYKTWPLWGMAAVFIAGTVIYYGIHTNLVLSDPDDTVWVQLYMHNIVNRILTCFATVPVYIGLLLWPAKLHMEYDHDITTTLSGQALAGLLIAGAAIGQIIYGRGRRAGAQLGHYLVYSGAVAEHRHPDTGQRRYGGRLDVCAEHRAFPRAGADGCALSRRVERKAPASPRLRARAACCTAAGDHDIFSKRNLGRRGYIFRKHASERLALWEDACHSRHAV